MAKHITNMNQLQKALQPVMVKMVVQLAEMVYKILNYYLTLIPGRHQRDPAEWKHSYGQQ